MNHLHKTASLLICAALLAATSALFCGCNNQPDHSSSSDFSGASIYAPTIPENPISKDEPGTVQEAAIGDSVNYNEKLTAKLEKVIELDTKSGTGGRVFLAEMTITNNSQAAIDCSTGTHFTTEIAGEADLDPIIDVSAAIFARQYYVAMNRSEFNNFNQEIAPGESISGYVSMKIPANVSEWKLIYTPYKYYSNDTIAFTITDDTITHYTQSF